mgnify:CR=1 FL=1
MASPSGWAVSSPWWIPADGWFNSDDVFEEEIRKQVLLAVDEADVIFVRL